MHLIRVETMKNHRRPMRTANVRKRLDKWVREGKHRLDYGSVELIQEDMGLIAEELRSYCSRKFKKRFLTWRKELRMKEARNMLLVYPSMPVCKVATALGIKDKSDFRHQFKSTTGCTPSEWRRKKSKKIWIIRFH